MKACVKGEQKNNEKMHLDLVNMTYPCVWNVEMSCTNNNWILCFGNGQKAWRPYMAIGTPVIISVMEVQRVSTDIAAFILYLDTPCEKSTSSSCHFNPWNRKHLCQFGGWVPEPVWTFRVSENLLLSPGFKLLSAQPVAYLHRLLYP